MNELEQAVWAATYGYYYARMKESLHTGIPVKRVNYCAESAANVADEAVAGLRKARPESSG